VCADGGATQPVFDRRPTCLEAITLEGLAEATKNPRTVPIDPLTWLRETLRAFRFDVVALYRLGGEHGWPLTASGPDDLHTKLEEGGHFVHLPKEPAALANILEVAIVEWLIEEAGRAPGLVASRGTERGYPDVELSGDALDGRYYAVDVKVARRNRAGTATQSRITLYTGNTYFKWPSLHWPGTFRPFQDYAMHLDVICLYDLSEERGRVSDLELLVHEAWRIGSRQRSSTTREYIGAVQRLDALRAAEGEFATSDEFYRFWRAYNFRIGRAVEQQLRRLLADQAPGGVPRP
jgi:hypothetical protein